MSQAAVPARSRALVSAFVTVLAIWIGGSITFSALVLPVLFIKMPSPAEAGAVAALLFPYYFRAGLACSLALLAIAAALARGAGRLWQAAIVIVAVLAAVQAYSAFLLQPEMAGLRGKPEHTARFQTLHRRSVQLNNVVLAGGMALLLSSGVLLLGRRER
ncbi:MAG TPA: DUF4149 domain-containing protein [Candidatus Binatia bacterium]|nr:DUF4149 domain-containing protein [Candidatus Binatia bacterium]